MKPIIIKIVIGIVFAYFGWQLTDKGLSSPSESSLKKYEKLCKSSVKTTGILDSTYSQTNFKIIKGSSGTKMNTFSYTFTVNDKVYKGSYTINTVPTNPFVTVWYDPTDPNSQLISDPCSQYEYSKDKKYPAWYSYVGIPMLLIGVGLLYGLFKSGVRRIFGIKPKPVQP